MDHTRRTHETRKEHRIPLASAACDVLSRLARHDEYVFPGNQGGPLSNMALHQLLLRMDRDDLTVHGFRSTFRTWAAERTGFAPHVVEMALAHAISNAIVASITGRKQFLGNHYYFVCRAVSEVVQYLVDS